MAATAGPLWGRAGAAVLVAVALLPTCGGNAYYPAGGLMDSERLFESDGRWHRAQRDRLSFEASCYYTHEMELPYGCQRGKVESDEWLNDETRVLEKQALLDLFENTGGEEWRANDNWPIIGKTEDTDPCWDFWYGVTCDEHGHVIYLELSDNKLMGELPNSLGNLRYLLKLDLSSTAPSYHTHANDEINIITGPLPSLRLATRLAEVEISGNQISALPADLWRNFPSLRMLSASHNLLTELPANMGIFSKLHTLELNNNLILANLTEASQDLGNLVEARYVKLSNNMLVGKVTDKVIGMTRIRVFDVSHNPELSGEVPENIITEWPEAEYISILNTSIVGYHSALCIVEPFCYKFMYSTHADLTWATAADVPAITFDTIEFAR